jgi:hypothetical protein
VHLVDFITRNLSLCTVTWASNLLSLSALGHFSPDIKSGHFCGLWPNFVFVVGCSFWGELLICLLVGVWLIDLYIQSVKNLKVDRQLSREYFMSDAIYNGSVGMTLYYYMCRSWQDCCRRGENRSWPSVSFESVDSKCWCLDNAIFYAFIMRLTVEERVFILESYLNDVLRPL